MCLLWQKWVRLAFLAGKTEWYIGRQAACKKEGAANTVSEEWARQAWRSKSSADRAATSECVQEVPGVKMAAGVHRLASCSKAGAAPQPTAPTTSRSRLRRRSRGWKAASSSRMACCQWGGVEAGGAVAGLANPSSSPSAPGRGRGDTLPCRAAPGCVAAAAASARAAGSPAGAVSFWRCRRCRRRFCRCLRLSRCGARRLLLASICCTTCSTAALRWLSRRLLAVSRLLEIGRAHV